MPIKLRKPPERAMGLVREGLSETLSHQVRDKSDRRRFKTLQYALPHPIFYAGIQSLIKRKLKSDAKMSGWRYLILQGAKPLCTVRLSFGPNRKLEFGHVSTSAFAGATIRALERAERLTKFKKRNFELRQLEIPGVDVVALWFHGASRDHFMPLPAESRKLKPYKLYTQRALITALRETAIRKVDIRDARA